MARKLWFLLPVALFAVLVVAFAVGLRHDPHLLPSALIDRPAPNFALHDVLENITLFRIGHMDDTFLSSLCRGNTASMLWV